MPAAVGETFIHGRHSSQRDGDDKRKLLIGPTCFDTRDVFFLRGYIFTNFISLEYWFRL